MKKVIIIGGGIAGLTAGVYACQSGFDVTIYEAHSIPGGASTSWKRKGYLFEGGMHWLTGSSPKTAFHKLWREVGALDDNTTIYTRDPFFAFEDNGKTAFLYRDIDKLQSHLIKLSPEDEKEIIRLCRDLRKFMKVDMPITDIKNIKVKEKSTIPISKLISMIPAFFRMSFYSNQTVKEYAMRYKNPFLQKLFRNIVGGDNNATSMLFTLSTLAKGDGGYPSGGSLAMAGRMAKRFEALGGIIKYNSKVERIIIKNGSVKSIIFNGAEISADAVIIAQDTLAAIDTLFDSPLREPWADKMRSEIKPMLNTFICLGIKEDLSDVHESIVFTSDTPVICAGEEIKEISINNYATYEGYAPKGCTAITSILAGDSYEWWKEQKINGTYESEKQKLAENFIDVLAKKYPQIAGRVEVCDIATPLTYERYLNSYKGSWMSIMGKGVKMQSYPSKPESISNLYFAGHRLIIPGGLPIALETGRKAVQYLCRDTNMVFQGNA
ncbi:NAD(P)/FAD-dependent oxidoreductase [Proteiniborus sp. MB09-C3]|uniref:phytoene desaturase family protein n=1 Tax=Proteiniborus sp. MB09-C3 TaxID=3050072 RepID=UPI0025543AD2|nr:NAD(P)/FAD-dependent oxidoreductase [Proteiniborus sp. MB09-C3]WIV11881.1 NAD(P)/FAD-dependent oxidoreductase [Proteiniborus sp. MB09-C3]